MATKLLAVQTPYQLAALLGVSYKKQIVYYTYRHWNPYHSFFVPRRGASGEPREIVAPHPTLRMTQSRLSKYLYAIATVRACVHGYVPGRGIRTNAEMHVGRRFVLNIDFDNFFGSIHHGRICGALVSMGLRPNIAKLISHICTREGVLPQGAPSSPVLSNIICWTLDKNLMKLAKKSNCFYSRYADDITFSTFRSRFPKSIAISGADGDGAQLELSKELLDIVNGNGFSINDSKTRLSTRSDRQSVTGVVVNEKINLARRYIRNIRASLFKWERVGGDALQEEFAGKYSRSRSADAGVASVEEFIRGRIQHIGAIRGFEDQLYRNMVGRFNKISSNSIKLKPIAPNPLLAKYLKAIWVIETDGDGALEETAQGTAFFVKGIGLVTCAHCVIVGKKTVIFRPKSPTKRYEVTVKQSSYPIDLAILEHAVPASEYEEFDRLAVSEVGHGDQLTIVGWPDFGPGDDITVRTGVAVGFKMVSGIRRIRVGVPVIHGTSGGPAFNKGGHIVGVAVTGTKTLADSDNSNDNALIPFEAIDHLLAKT